MNLEFKIGDHVLIRNNNTSGIIVAEETEGVFLVKSDSENGKTFSLKENDLVLLKAGKESADMSFNRTIKDLNRYLEKNYKPPLSEAQIKEREEELSRFLNELMNLKTKNSSGSESSQSESTSEDVPETDTQDITVQKSTENIDEESTDKKPVASEDEHHRQGRAALKLLTSIFRKLKFWIKSDKEDENVGPDAGNGYAGLQVPEFFPYQSVSADENITVLQDPKSSNSKSSESLTDDNSETVTEDSASVNYKPSFNNSSKPSMHEASEHHDFEASKIKQPKPFSNSYREYSSFEAPKSPYSQPASHSGRKPVILGAPKAKYGYDIAESGDYSLARLDSLVRSRHETFQEMLFRLIDESGKSDSEVYTKANVDRKYFSKIRSGNIPRRATVMALCLALHLSSDVAADLMNKAGYGFSDANITDLIIVYCLQERIFELDTVNDILHSYSEDYLRV